MTFFTIVYPDQFYLFQNDLKNIPNKVTSNMEAYPFLKHLLVQTMLYIRKQLTTTIKYRRVHCMLLLCQIRVSE